VPELVERHGLMLEKQKLENGKVRVTFRLSQIIWADRIALVGDFNDWAKDSHFLEQTHIDMDWHITLDLEPRRSYRFRYLVNGEEWMDDDRADGYEPNPFGGFDSIVDTGEDD
jgi:1,4-alpha-glucan branching enzyme